MTFLFLFIKLKLTVIKIDHFLKRKKIFNLTFVEGHNLNGIE